MMPVHIKTIYYYGLVTRSLKQSGKEIHTGDNRSFELHPKNFVIDRMYYANGKLRDQQMFLDGLKHGQSIGFHPDGRVWYERFYYYGNIAANYNIIEDTWRTQ